MASSYSCCRSLRLALVDAEGPYPHDPWLQLVTSEPPIYDYEIPYAVSRRNQ